MRLESKLSTSFIRTISLRGLNRKTGGSSGIFKNFKTLDSHCERLT